jgi:hypothetical protein
MCFVDHVINSRWLFLLKPLLAKKFSTPKSISPGKKFYHLSNYKNDFQIQLKNYTPKKNRHPFITDALSEKNET